MIWIIISVYILGMLAFAAWVTVPLLDPDPCDEDTYRSLIGLFWPLVTVLLLLYVLFNSIGWAGETLERGVRALLQRFTKKHPPVPTEQA